MAIEIQLVTAIGISIAGTQVAIPAQRAGVPDDRLAAEVMVGKQPMAFRRDIFRRETEGPLQDRLLPDDGGGGQQQQTQQRHFEFRARHQADGLAGICGDTFMQARNIQAGHYRVKALPERYYMTTLSGR